jgi:hypothetical protein
MPGVAHEVALFQLRSILVAHGVQNGQPNVMRRSEESHQCVRLEDLCVIHKDSKVLTRAWSQCK